MLESVKIRHDVGMIEHQERLALLDRVQLEPDLIARV